MIIDDVSEFQHGERLAHFYNQVVGPNANLEQRVNLHEAAWREATAEMLNEIHTMLRQLTIESNTEDRS